MYARRRKCPRGPPGFYGARDSAITLDFMAPEPPRPLVLSCLSGGPLLPGFFFEGGGGRGRFCCGTVRKKLSCIIVCDDPWMKGCTGYT